MRLKLTALFIALLVCCGLLIGDGSLANQQTQRASQRFTISKYGTLLEFDADGTGITKKVIGDGFELGYKSPGKTRTVFAIESEAKGLQTSSEQAKYEPDTATAIVQTADKLLKITSYLVLDDKAGELIIKRRFQNISDYPVTLQTVRNHIDPEVMTRVKQPGRLFSDYLGLITAGYFSDPYDCDIGECPVQPICPACPLPPLPPLPSRYLKNFRAWMYPSEREIVLGWTEQITLKPKDSASIVIRLTIK